MFERRHLKDVTLWVIFGLFFIITLWGLINHAPWRDEAQSWLLVRDLNLGGLINQMSYEGTPPLWHLILFPLAKLGLPYASELIIHYLFALALIFLLIFFSPLPRIIKFILPFSYFFLFEYTVIARNYNLTALLLFIIAFIYRDRFKRPILYAFLVFFLAWTNTHSLAMAAVLFCIFLYEIIKEGRSELKYLWGVVIMELGLVSAVLILIPKMDQYFGLGFNNWHTIARSLSVALLPFFENPTIPAYLLYPLSLAWIPLIFILKKNQSKILLLLPVFWLEFIFLFKYPCSVRHYGLILIFFLFAWWIDLVSDEKKSTKTGDVKYKITVYLLSICLALSTIYAGYFYLTNIRKNFSGAKEMAQYIKNNHLESEEIAAYPSYSGSALLPYLPNKEFYQVETLKKGTFLTWNNAFYSGDVAPFPNLKKYLKYYYSLPPQNKVDSILILTALPEGSNQESEFIFENTNPELEFIFKNTKETVKQDEFFYLYRLRLR